MRSIATIASRMFDVFVERAATLVVTQPYEGGHPDHHATALAVRLAVDSAKDSGGASVVVECTAYHSDEAGALVTGTFLKGATPIRVVTLDDGARIRRASMLACFASQQQTLAPSVPIARRFVSRRSTTSRYRHTRGGLHYERFQWGVRDGAQWRMLAAREVSAFAAGVHAR